MNLAAARNQATTRRRFVRNTFLALNGLHLRLALAQAPSEPAILDLKILDAGTGRPIPCSVALWTSDGTLITKEPGYALGLRSTGEVHSTVLAGRVKLVVTRGFDYQAEERQLLLTPGSTRTCVIELRRVSTLRSDGWVCGDNHVHMKHGEGPIQSEFSFLALTARAEALDYMSVAQAWNVPIVTPELLSKACAAVSNNDCTLHWNMEAPKNYWKGDVSHCMGHGWLLGVRDQGPGGTDPIAELFAMSAGDYQKEKVPTPNFESHAYIHASGGIVAYTHPARIWRGTWGGRNGFPIQNEKFVSNIAQELPFDTVAGPTYDCIDVMMTTQEHLVNELGQQLWFMLLNKGYRLPATASTDASFDNPGHATPGAVRVYTKIQGSLTIAKIAASMKSGRNFVTSGPLLEFTIGEHHVGDIIPTAKDGRYLARVKAWASGAPGERLTRIEIIRNGELLHTYTVAELSKFHEVTFDVQELATAWYVVKCFGSNSDQVAMSNPIYFQDETYRAPEAAMADLDLNVVKAGSGEPLDGTYEVVQMIGREPRIIGTGAVESGRATVTAPPTSRIRIHAPGYESQMKSIFIDTPELLNLTMELQLADLVNWRTYETVRSILQKISFTYEMGAKANSGESKG